MPSTLRLVSPVRYISHIGPMMAEKLEKLDIRTVKDLLYDVPTRYNDFSVTTPINRIVPGASVTIKGRVTTITNVFTKNGKRFTQGKIMDATGIITAVWFNQPFLTKVIHAEDEIAVSGKIGWFGRALTIESPVYELIGAGVSLHTGRLVPVYSETEGVTSKWLRTRIHEVLSLMIPTLTDPIPDTILMKNSLIALPDALQQIHFPASIGQAEQAKKRLAFDELFLLCLRSSILRSTFEEEHIAPILSAADTLLQKFSQALPFALTKDQKIAIDQILTDIKRSIPMNRLLAGDVGSGKTVVAAAAIYIAAKKGYRSLFMAPTVILAEQHYATIKQFLEPFGITVAFIHSGVKEKDRNNEADVIVGTHALLQKHETYQKIGLIVVDEQQRFGVAQRALLKEKTEKGFMPHFLTMSATPIPRTLALTVYGNLDLSVLQTMPLGRKIIKTWVVPENKRRSAYEWIEKSVNGGSTVFLVCPFIEPSETMVTVKAAKTEFERLKKEIFPSIPMGLLHGRMKSEEKMKILDDFQMKKIKILVATPVVEVGIDVSHAGIMMIEASERFGLSQLHQLRGRVGRNDQQAFCLLFTESKNEETLTRLKLLERVNSGPELAEMDLKLRGEGDILGTRQHGIPSLVLASLSDTTLVQNAKAASSEVIGVDPALSSFPLLRELVKNDIIDEVSKD